MMPKPEDILSFGKHLEACIQAKKEMREGIKEEFAEFRNYFKSEVEIKVLQLLKNLDGTLEEKIENIADKVVSRHTEELRKEISKTIELVEVVKVLAKRE